MNEYTKNWKKKGWTAKTLSKRWKISIDTVYKIAKNPKPKDWDAMKGLPVYQE